MAPGNEMSSKKPQERVTPSYSPFYFPLGWNWCFSSEGIFFKPCGIAVTPSNLGFLSVCFKKELNPQLGRVECSKPPTCVFNLEL